MGELRQDIITDALRDRDEWIKTTIPPDEVAPPQPVQAETPVDPIRRRFLIGALRQEAAGRRQARVSRTQQELGRLGFSR